MTSPRDAARRKQRGFIAKYETQVEIEALEESASKVPALEAEVAR